MVKQILDILRFSASGPISFCVAYQVEPIICGFWSSHEDLLIEDAKHLLGCGILHGLLSVAVLLV